jgi:DNA (cytosine-5)-methyltransferase 1
MLTFGSVCSGIEAASVAWSPLGWKSAFFSEIEAFPSAVLSHRHPDTPNLGDMTKFKEWPDATIDVLVGGTPCQSFSVAGLRKGLDDPRGNLMLTYLAIADRYRPRWLVWENVPGVLSSNGGGDFAAFLFGLGECGYGFAYRVLDAQYFGLAQRRKRVFVVASLRGWQSAAAVLFERASLSGHPAPSRESGQKTAPTIAGCANGGGSNGPGRDVDSVESLQVVAMAHGQGGAEIASERSPTLTCNHEAPIVFHLTQEPINSVDICHALNANANATAAVLAFDTTQVTSRGNVSNPKFGDPCHPLAAGAHAPAVAYGFQPRIARNGRGDMGDVVSALAAQSGGTGKGDAAPCVATAMQVRRLTPRECERLQGFSDDYTAIPWRKKTADQCPDGPRYKALGNSMAVPVMRWIGERIDLVEGIEQNRSAA